MIPDRNFLFLLCSARRDGNSEQLARLAASSLSDPHRWLDLNQPALPPLTDLRPLPPHPAQGRLAEVQEAVFAASDLVFVAPVYWYALPAPAHLLLGHWSSWLDQPKAGVFDLMKGRRVWMITSRSDPDPSVPDLPEAMLKRTVLWLGMHWGGALHGIGDAPGEVLRDENAVAGAAGFLR